MTNIFVLINPVSANSTTGKIWPEIEQAMKERGLKFTAYITQTAGDAIEVVRTALKNGYETVVSVGGDGTINEVVNGFFEKGAAINPNARLAVISCGTGCDFIRTLGIPKDYKGALDVIIANREKSIDLALMEFVLDDGTPVKRFYANITDAGLGAVVAKKVNDSSKSAGGFFSFLYNTVKTVMSYKNREGRVKVDGKEVYQGSLTMVAVANGRYLGGGMHLAPIAVLDDGKLDLILVTGMKKATMFRSLLRIYRGTHLSISQVSTCQAEEVVIDGVKPIEIELDGETPGTTPAKITICPGAIKVLY